MAAAPELHPHALRGTPVEAVILTNGDVDHIAGLLTLRERTCFDLLATSDILAILEENSVFGVMARDVVNRRRIEVGAPFEAAGLNFRAFAVPGKVALFKEGETVDTAAMGDQTVGLEIWHGAQRIYYVPGCAALPDWLVEQLSDGDLILFDGTVWEDDDMHRTGTGKKTGLRMGHLPMSGPDGSLARLAGVRARKVYIHLNNTNPAIRPDGPERAAITNAGWTIAQDGMEFRP